MDLGRRTPDTLLVRVELGKDDCDPFVLCVAQKKVATRLAKEMQDLVRVNSFCSSGACNYYFFRMDTTITFVRDFVREIKKKKLVNSLYANLDI